MRGTKEDELTEVINLINQVFRTGRGNLPHTMEKEFPLLLSPENAGNMRIIKEEKMIISVVNYLPRKILIEGTPVSAGSIGGVCTHSDHRGKGYSSRILKDVEKRMRETGVNLCLISGTRNLYKKWGAERVKNCRRYRISAGLPHLKYIVREYKKEDLLFLKKIYNSRGTRYLRPGTDFEILLDSGTFPFGDTSYKKYVLEDENGLRGYIILKKTHEKIEVKEAGGEKSEVFDALAFLGTQLGVEGIDYVLTDGERAPLGYPGGEEFLSGTLKIIDFVGFMGELRPYLEQYFPHEGLSLFKAEEADGKYRLSLGSEKLEIESHKELLKLIFEKKEKKKEKNMGKLEELIDTIFPLPFPWTENLNYQ
ncbi:MULTISPECIES: GNAT family N-acetyltransferase [Psychrilyobacter]|uniref:GNAT family N-acetyltransferase n=1 Tax=Psychrilyobacter TaxID=623282 RepID=UPI0021016143|nr:MULTISPECIES: GNAT family N-acetyltransferase [Psychrilyobacter]MCS5422548.1 GNAT family N-acetyltransferase [Psychrilyobacter sp. S5]